MKEFAVSFKGGMARGVGGIGLMRFFQEENIKPKYYAGSSSGALVAAGFAMNFTWDRVLEDFKKVRLAKLILISSLLKKGGVISREKFLEQLSEVLETPIQQIEIKNLPSKLFIFASSLKKRERIIIQSGNLGEALIKSCAYPLILERNDDYLEIIDGDFTSSYSANYLRKKGAQAVIGCGYRPKRTSLFTANPLDITISTYRLLSEQIDEYYEKIDPVDFELEYNADDIGYTNFKMVDKLVDRVYRKAKNHKKEIFNALDL